MEIADSSKIVGAYDQRYVEILLATCNGEKFLAEQLASLSAQTHTHWKILARDDKSTDGTFAILKNFQKLNPGKIKIFDDNGQQLSAPYNFLYLMKQSTADIVLFCDQDDIWHPDKIEKCVDEITAMEHKHGKRTPVLVHHDVSIMNGQGDREQPSYHRHFRIAAENTGLNRLLLMNAVHGMSMTANRALIDAALPHPDVIESHDHYLSLVAEISGKIGYMPCPLADYRIHNANTSGIGNYYKDTFNGIASASSRIQTKITQRCAAARSFEEKHSGILSEHQSQLFKDFSTIPNKPWMARKLDICRHGPWQVLNKRSLLFLFHG